MSRRVGSQPKRHSQRVAAWIYTVINPIWEGLQREIELLERGNTTWRYFSGRCEFIRPVQEYVDSTQWPNYFDFFKEEENVQFEIGFRSHDQALGTLNNSAGILFERLLSLPQFNEKFQSSIRKYQETHVPDSIVLDLTNDELRKSVAEYLINKVEVLPAHYSYSKFWAQASGSMFEFANMDEFEPVRSAAGMLKIISFQVKTALEDRRLELSRTFDLPSARPPDYLSGR